MENAWPLWALPFWTMGVPLIWAFIEKIRTPRFDAHSANWRSEKHRADGTSLGMVGNQQLGMQ